MATETRLTAHYFTRGSATQFVPYPRHHGAERARSIEVQIRSASPTATQLLIRVKLGGGEPTVSPSLKAIYEQQRRLARASLETAQLARRSFDASVIAYVVSDASAALGRTPYFDVPDPWLAFADSRKRLSFSIFREIWSATAGDESSLRNVLRMQRRAQRLAQLTAPQRETFERIRQLRDRIGPTDFDVSEALQELRERA
jgi:hypothetical protein